MSEKMLDSLKKLDPNNDNHWTVDGLAKLDTVKFLSGVSVTREELDKIAPGFNREAMRKWLTSGEADAKAKAPEPVRNGNGTGKPSDVSEQPKVANGTANREVEVKTLAEEVARADEAVNEAKRIHDEALAKLEAARAHSDALHDRLIVINPPPTHQENIRNYLASVRVTNQQRAAAREELTNSGIDIARLQAIAAPSPIDISLKNRRR